MQLVPPLVWGDGTTEMNSFRSRCARQLSVSWNFLTKLHLIADAEMAFKARRLRISCQSSGRNSCSVTTYAFSTPNAFTFLIIVPMFLRSFGYSITAMRFLQRKSLILSALARRDGFDFLVSSMDNMSGFLLPELLGKPDENSFETPDVAEPIRVFVLDHFADELRAALTKPGDRIVDVLHGEHDA